MPVMLCKCGCGVGGVCGYHHLWLYSCYLSVKDYEIFLNRDIPIHPMHTPNFVFVDASLV